MQHMRVMTGLVQAIHAGPTHQISGNRDLLRGVDARHKAAQGRA
jgi:hypothetical protein